MKKILVCYVPKSIKLNPQEFQLGDHLKEDYHVIVVHSEVRDDWHFRILSESVDKVITGTDLANVMGQVKG